jgi:hypothetical protein
MAHIILSHAEPQKSAAAPGTGLCLAVVLVVWLGLVFALGTGAVFVTPQGRLPFPLLLAFTVPIGMFVAAFWLSPAFHAFVLAADLRLMTGIQAWRFAGFGFLALYAHGVLPGIFAWPAGLGDIAISVTAPWMLVTLIRQPHFAASKTFMAWNVLGILDLVVAVGLGALSSRLGGEVASAVTTGPMAHLPLVLIPAYFVPAFIMLHLAALFQARRLVGERRR